MDETTLGNAEAPGLKPGRYKGKTGWSTRSEIEARWGVAWCAPTEVRVGQPGFVCLRLKPQKRRQAAALQNWCCELFGGEVVGVDWGVAGPLFRQVFEGEDGGYGADGDAGAAVDAFDGIDVELLFGVVAGLVFARVDAVHRADVDAGGIFCADARLGDYVSHLLLLGQIADRCLPGVYSFALKALPAKPFCLLRVTFGSSLLMIVRDEGGILNWGALRAREGKVWRLGRALQRLRQRREERHGSED